MNPAQRLAELLAGLAAKLGLDALPVGENGICTLVIDDALPLNIAVDAPGRDLMLFSPLGDLPAAQRGEFMVRMLRANGAGASIYTFGLAPAGDAALLSARYPMADLDAAALERAAGEFVSVAAHWRTALAAPAPAQDGQAPGNGWLQA
ncbi:type III secretion system chaperone [Achromobacter spanius]|uniref:type III secretion system chaperone n=1 Tax=Achromobacter spanius TaxID=217203 RepID=UPI00320BA1E3